MQALPVRQQRAAMPWHAKHDQTASHSLYQRTRVVATPNGISGASCTCRTRQHGRLATKGMALSFAIRPHGVLQVAINGVSIKKTVWHD